MDMLAELDAALRAKWRLHAYREVVTEGQLFYFVLSCAANDWVVLPAWGTSVVDARRRLESSLRLLGVAGGKLLERESGPVGGRLALPLCRDCSAIMRPDGHRLGGWIQLWRCGVNRCRSRSWTLGGRILPAQPVTLYGRNSPCDIDV